MAAMLPDCLGIFQADVDATPVVEVDNTRVAVGSFHTARYGAGSHAERTMHNERGAMEKIPSLILRVRGALRRIYGGLRQHSRRSRSSSGPARRLASQLRSPRRVVAAHAANIAAM